MWLWMSMASAQQTDWQLVASPALPHWVVGSGRVWLRDGADCLPVEVDDAARGLLAVETCREGPLVCETVLELSGGLSLRSDRCTLTAEGGLGATQSSSREGSPPFALSSADEQVVRYVPVTHLVAWQPAPVYEQAPCDKKSLKTMRREGRSAQTTRTCELSSRIELSTEVGSITKDLRVLSEPVDCTIPCPEDPTRSELDALHAKLQLEWYARPDATGPQLYREVQACRMAADTPALLARDACVHSSIRPAPGR